MARIHPSAVIDADAHLADDVVVGPNCVIGKETQIGSGCTLAANVVIESGVVIGRNNHFYPHVAVGTLPQILGWGPDADAGGLVIGDNNTFREQVTLHRSMYPGEVTQIGSENLLMVGVHIGHDCVLEDKLVLTNLTQLSGHCKLETGVWISGLVGLHQFVTIGRWCYVAGHSTVIRDVPPFLVVSGNYPMRVRGVNGRGLRRAGFSETQQAAICRAYHQLYRCRQGSLLERARRMEQEDHWDENVRAMVENIKRSSQHRFGRHLELHRH